MEARVLFPSLWQSGALFFSFFFGVEHLHTCILHTALAFCLLLYVTTRDSIEKGANGFRFECYSNAFRSVCKPLTILHFTPCRCSLCYAIPKITNNYFQHSNSLKISFIVRRMFSSKVALICKSRRRQVDEQIGWWNMSSLAREFIIEKLLLSSEIDIIDIEP